MRALIYSLFSWMDCSYLMKYAASSQVCNLTLCKIPWPNNAFKKKHLLLRMISMHPRFADGLGTSVSIGYHSGVRMGWGLATYVHLKGHHSNSMCHVGHSQAEHHKRELITS